MHQIAGKAVAFGEALQPSFREYQAQVLENARTLATALQTLGLPIVTGGTDNHIVLVDLKGKDTNGAEVEDRCRAAGLYVNKNMVPGDPLSPRVTSGIRLGTAAATTRGMRGNSMQRLAEILAELIGGSEPTAFRSEILEMGRAHPLP